MLVVGQPGRKSPSSPTPALSTESCGLLAADYSSSVTFRESEVRVCGGQVSSSPRRPRGPASPRLPLAFSDAHPEVPPITAARLAIKVWSRQSLRNHCRADITRWLV